MNSEKSRITKLRASHIECFHLDYRFITAEIMTIMHRHGIPRGALAYRISRFFLSLDDDVSDANR